ncbi:hypothetical protein GCM10023196_039370 [Actinoallomurus vinaceus]|uniref:Uncharacterized protein n=1 Tax=Actinoallomurus vinaceus TaxID=1080074 RepID=A0ABP8UCP5_9ACTN
MGNIPAARSLHQAVLTPIDATKTNELSGVANEPGAWEKLRLAQAVQRARSVGTSGKQDQVRLSKLWYAKNAASPVRTTVDLGQLFGGHIADAAQQLARMPADELTREAEADLSKLANAPDGTPYAAARDELEAALEAFRLRLHAVYLGVLHVQRMDLLPAGMAGGELVHSLPLAPGEKVHLTRREWSNTASDFQTIVTDYEESFSEQGVTEKTELAESTTSQHQHSLGLNTSVSASGGFGPMSVSASGAFSMTDQTSLASADSTKRSQELTKKASARTKQEHKISFRVSSAAGSEQEQVSTVRNPYADRGCRVDYYQLQRKWLVELREFDKRLCLDVNIPEPGFELLDRYREIQDLQGRLGAQFDMTGIIDPDHPNAPLTAESITRDNWSRLASAFGTSIDPPPGATIRLYVSDTPRTWDNDDNTTQGAGRWHWFTFGVDIDPNYVVQTARVDWDKDGFSDFTGDFVDNPTAGADFFVRGVGPDKHELLDWRGFGGHFDIHYGAYHVKSCSVWVTGILRLRDEVFTAWQQKAYAAIKDAALGNFYAEQTQLRDRLDALKAELGAQDPLSLRKVEREEVMKGVVRWIFGPEFAFSPAVVGSTLYDPATGQILNQQIWDAMASQGQTIQFVHHAIEWENIAYFLYPYFWSAHNRWALKTGLDHPDFTHKAFLKAGSARVVVPIRRGFESAFLAFVRTGHTDGSDPYVTLADEFRADADARYPNTPSPDPDESDQQRLGNLVSSWYEFTPTAALDVQVTSSLPDDAAGSTANSES